MQKITKEMTHFGSNKSNAAKSDVGVQLPLTQNSLSSKVLLVVAFLCCLLVQDLFGQPPTITGFTPASGPVGTTVTVTGANFSTTPANNIVIFGATCATVSASTSTQLTVTVPVGATYSPITILNTATDLLAYSSTNFTPTFTPSEGSITTNDFSAAVGFVTGAFPISIPIGDLDGDGKPDVVVANYSDNTISVLRNTSTVGTINYAAKVDFVTGTNPSSVAMGDLDGDGKLDLAVANMGVSTNTISVFRNTSMPGTISFTATEDVATGSGPQGVSIGDLDSDGKADLAVATYNTNKVSVFRNTSTVGTISFATSTDFSTASNPYAVSIGDLDGDGKPDLAVVNYWSGSVSVFRNTSAPGTISYAAKVDFATGLNPRSVSIGDLDGDGKADLAVMTQSSFYIHLLRNTSTTGTINFATKVDVSTGSNSAGIGIGDLDGDGNPDLATGNQNITTVSVFRNTSTVGIISYAAKVEFASGANPSSISIGDLDGDGQSDLVATNSVDNSISVLRNKSVVAGSPTITSFTPASGPVGTSVTISGTNFNATAANNSVKFNGTTATVTASTTTSITTTVPAGATSGRITVTAGGNTGTSSGDFTVIVAQPEINIKQNTLTVTSAGTYAFGDQTINMAGAPVAFTIENTGGGVLNLSGNPKIAIAGAHASAFTVIQTATAATVQAAATTSFTVSFAPTTLGNKTARLSIANNDSNESPYIIYLTGMGISCVIPEKPTITQESNSDFTTSTLTSSGVMEGGTYQWFKDGTPIDNATAQTYTTSEIGIYTVRITVPGDCSATSDPFAIIITDTEESTSAGDFVLYPNPATDWLTLLLDKWQGKKKIVIYEATGKQWTSNETLTKEAKLYVGNFPAGTYIVTVSSFNSVGVLKFIKQ